MRSINPIFILKNKTFREIILFDKKLLFFTLFFSIFSTIIFTGFPLITQFYLKYLYIGGDINQLTFFTILFIFLYIFKLIIDIFVEKYKNIFFLILERNIKEKIVMKYNSDLENFLKKKKSLFTKDIGLFTLLIRTIYSNILDLTKIIIIVVIIYFFDRNLFFYFLFSVPFFFIFYFLLKRNMLNKKSSVKRSELDFSLLLNYLLKRENSKDRISFARYNLNQNLEKQINGKTNHIVINQIIRSFVNFYRLFYLFYFGVLIIIGHYSIVSLIVGLLFLTILIKAINNLIISVPLYTICSKSFFKINALMRDNN